MSRLVALAALVLVSLAPGSAAPALQDPLTLVISRDGGPPKDVTVFTLLNGQKRSDSGPSLKAVAAKYPKGTIVNVYRWWCEDDKIQLILVPAGESLGVEDKDCLKSKEPPPGYTCRCNRIGAFSLGDFTTIDAETGRIK